MLNNNVYSLQSQAYTELDFAQLPVRAEKRLVPYSPVMSGFTAADFTLTGAARSYFQFALIRIPGRGMVNGIPDPSQAAYFQFLVNPSQVSVGKQTMDGQANTKGGWQIGVAGEDFTTVSISGKTPGNYFARGLTDEYREFTMSYRNLASLEMLYENNGFWFEGEQMREGALASPSLRRRIKMHQDVELVMGEFIWTGMFEDMSISQSADSPFLSNFTLNFTAWKERYRQASTFRSPHPNSIQRGHTTSAVAIAASISGGTGASSTTVQGASADTTIPVIPLTDIQNPADGIFST